MRNVLAIAIFLLCGTALGEGDHLHTRERSEWNSTTVDSSVNNIPVTPDGGAGSKLATRLSGTGDAAVVGHSDHATFCSTATTMIRVRYSDTSAVAPASLVAYNFIVPAASSGSFVCVTLDDVQLGQYFHIWSDGSAISSGKFWAYGW